MYSIMEYSWKLCSKYAGTCWHQTIHLCRVIINQRYYSLLCRVGAKEFGFWNFSEEVKKGIRSWFVYYFMCHMLAPDFGKNDSSSRPQETSCRSGFPALLSSLLLTLTPICPIGQYFGKLSPIRSAAEFKQREVEIKFISSVQGVFKK